MSLSDPLGDMLTRIRNALAAGHTTVELRHSKLKGEIARVLKEEGFITDYQIDGDGVRRQVGITLKYFGDDNQPAISGLKRVSRPGLRNYASCKEVRRVLSGMGIAIISTSSGIMTDKQARKAGVGGETLCQVW